MSHLRIATGPGIRPWTDGPFSFRMTRDAGFRFLNGPFTMIGLTPVDPARDGFMLCGSPAILTDPGLARGTGLCRGQQGESAAICDRRSLR